MKILNTHHTPHGVFRTAVPETADEFENYYELRWQVLRKPLNKPRGSEQEGSEQDKFNFALLNAADEMIGTCCLQLNSADEAQVRYMAVNAMYRGKQLGDLLLKEAEQKAALLHAKYVFLQSRESAVHFYKRNGYYYC